MDSDTGTHESDLYIGKASGTDWTGHYGSYVDFLNQVFQPDSPDGFFYRILPKLYNDPALVMENSYIITEGGDFCAAVGSFPFRTSVLGRPLNGRIIGNVAVHAQARSKGYMKQLMSLAMADARSEGTDYMLLGGLRHRYRYFSFEACGFGYSFTVTTTNLRHCYGVDRRSAVALKEIQRSDVTALSEIAVLHNRQPFHIQRPRERLYETLISWESRPYAAYVGADLVGYLVLDHGGNTVVEFVAGARSVAEEMVIAALTQMEKNELSFHLPPFATEAIALLTDLCEACTVFSDVKYTVLNFCNVLAAMLPLRAAYLPLADGTVVLRIHGFAGLQSLRLTVAGRRIEVTETNGLPDLELSHLDAMNLLFSVCCPRRSALPPAIASWFPLPLYISPLDNA